MLQVPLKYANHVTGASYIISFGVGSAIVTVAALAAVNLTHTFRHRCVAVGCCVAHRPSLTPPLEGTRSICRMLSERYGKPVQNAALRFPAGSGCRSACKPDLITARLRSSGHACGATNYLLTPVTLTVTPQCVPDRPWAEFKPARVAPPGLLAGLLWSIGNFTGIKPACRSQRGTGNLHSSTPNCILVITRNKLFAGVLYDPRQVITGGGTAELQ